VINNCKELTVEVTISNYGKIYENCNTIYRLKTGMATLGIIILPEQKPIVTSLSRKCYNAASAKVVESGDLAV